MQRRDQNVPTFEDRILDRIATCGIVCEPQKLKTVYTKEQLYFG